MDQRYSAIDAIAHLGKTFQSIDCRALVVNQKADEKDKDGNQLEAWMSVFLVIRFSHTPVEMVQAKYRDLIGEFTDIRTKRFRIIAEAFAFDKWDAIADSLATGRMVLQGVTFSLKKSIQPAELSGQPWKHPTYVRSEYRPQF